MTQGGTEMHVTTSQLPAPNLPLQSSAPTLLLSFTLSHFSAIRIEHNPTHGLCEQHVAGNTGSTANHGAQTMRHCPRHSHLLQATELKESTQLGWVIASQREQGPPGAMISHRTPAESNDLSFTGWLQEDITHSTAISHSTRMQGSSRALCTQNRF